MTDARVMRNMCAVTTNSKVSMGSVVVYSRALQDMLSETPARLGSSAHFTASRMIRTYPTKNSGIEILASDSTLAARSNRLFCQIADAMPSSIDSGITTSAAYLARNSVL